MRVTSEDRTRLGADARELVVFVDGESYMRLDRTGPVGRCAALGIAEDGRFACTVYERRPEICRAFERGSASCLADRAVKGGRPRRLLETLTRGRG